MKELTKDQKLIISGYFGCLAGVGLQDLLDDVARRTKRPANNADMARENYLKDLYAADFKRIIGE